MVEVDVCRVDAGAGQGVRLVVRVLVRGGDSRISDQHVSIVLVRQGLTTLISGTGFRHEFRGVSPTGSGCRQMIVFQHSQRSLPGSGREPDPDSLVEDRLA